MMTNNITEFISLLGEFVSFKSISTDPSYKKDVGETSLWLSRLLKKSGFAVTLFKDPSVNPVVFGHYQVSKAAQTLLIYGHYDVQPAEKSDGWKSSPFKLTQVGGKLLGRGVVDNKGQVLTHIFTVMKLIKEGNLGYNIKFLIEGNEETSNPALAKIVSKNRKLLSCDAMIVSDGELTNNKPTVEASLRGGFNAKLIYTSGKNNLHSGLFGGAVPNSANELSILLSKLFKSDGTVSYKQFYGGVDRITPSESANNKTLTKQAHDLVGLAGVKSLLIPKGSNFFTQTGLVPTIQVTGLKSGYIGDGFANIVPGQAEVRLNFRLVTSQNPKKIADSFKEFVVDNTPNYIDYELVFEGLHDPIKINTNNSFVSEAERVLKGVYKMDVVRKNVGGAIPFVADVKKILGVDTVLVPLANEDCNMHGANENFDIDLIKKGLAFSRELFSTK